MSTDILLAIRAQTFKIIAEDYTLTDKDVKIYVNSASVVTISVPDAISFAGWRFEIKNQGTGTVTAQIIIEDQLIDGETTQTIEQYENLIIDSDGINWWVK